MQTKMKTILLVDDDPITNFINLRLIKKMKITDEVKAVTNGEEGLKCLDDHCFKGSHSPELILLDINMPVMDGFEFLTAYNSMNFKNKDNVVIAILTSSSHPKDKKRMEDLGIFFFVNKPLTEEKIRECINQFVHPSQFNFKKDY
jgi:CheY-like chemotaxis protein